MIKLDLDSSFNLNLDFDPRQEDAKRMQGRQWRQQRHLRRGLGKVKKTVPLPTWEAS